MIHGRGEPESFYPSPRYEAAAQRGAEISVPCALDEFRDVDCFGEANYDKAPCPDPIPSSLFPTTASSGHRGTRSLG